MSTKKTKRPAHRPPHQPTAEGRAQVEVFSSCGIPQDHIAAILDIDPKTLRKHYRRELDSGAPKANARVAHSLFRKAVDGDTTAMIFWLKTRAGWRESSHVDITTTERRPEDSFIEQALKARYDEPD